MRTSRSIIRGLIAVLSFIILTSGLFGQEDGVIAHIPVTQFEPGQQIKIQALLSGDVDWIKLFIRKKGDSPFQVLTMARSEGGIHICYFDLSLNPGFEFEYYLMARSKDNIIFYPEKAPEELIQSIVRGEKAGTPAPEGYPAANKEIRKMRWPLTLNGTLKQIVNENNSLAANSKTAFFGNLSFFYNIQNQKGFSFNLSSTLSYTNIPLPGMPDLNLPLMMVSISTSNHLLKIGDINVRESEYSISGTGRRGVEYLFNNTKLYFRLFDISSQQSVKFEGIGISRPDSRIMGGVLGYRLFKDVISVKAIYLSGEDNPEQGANIGFATFFKSRKGTTIAVVEETQLFKNKLNISAEFSRSDCDPDLSDNQGSVADNAWKIKGTFSSGFFHLGASYCSIGRDFNSIGHQFFTSDRKGLDLTAGISFNRFSLSGLYSQFQNNVKDDPGQYTTRNNQGRVDLFWGLSEKISFNLAYLKNKQDTQHNRARTQLEDGLIDEISAGLNLSCSASSGLSLTAGYSHLTSQNMPDKDTDSRTLQLGGYFGSGQAASISSSLGISLVTNKSTAQQSLGYNFFLTSETYVIRRWLSLQLIGSVFRNEIPISGISHSFYLEGGFNLYLEKLIRVGALILSFKGNFSSSKYSGVSESHYELFFRGSFSL